jgi:hypothetical protein
MNLLKKALPLNLGISVLIASQVFGGAGFGQSTPAPATRPASQPAMPTPPADRTRYAPNRFPKRALMYYENVWGIDSLTVRAAESGELIRFNYRVLDPVKSRQLNDKKSEPFLVDPRAGVKLVIPSLEKVGQLRQSITPEEGKVYWMAFSNPRRTVKPGDRVNVVIGHFHADGLVVE